MAQSPNLKKITVLVGAILLLFGVTLVATLSYPTAPLIIGASSLAGGAALLIATLICLAPRFPLLCRAPSQVPKLTLEDFKESDWIRREDSSLGNFYGVRGYEDRFYLFQGNEEEMVIYCDEQKITPESKHYEESPKELRSENLQGKPILSGTCKESAFFAVKLWNSKLFILAQIDSVDTIYIDGEEQAELSDT